jgi:hypothetical protein
VFVIALVSAALAFVTVFFTPRIDLKDKPAASPVSAD